VSILHIYFRVLGLLAPEKGLAITLTLANLALAGVFFLEPWLFGHVVDSLAAKGHTDAWRYIGWWAAVGFGGIIANVWVSLHADRLAHRRRLAAISQFFAHAVALPLSFHGAHHTGRLLRVMHGGTNNLFSLWLGFFREHLATLLSIVVMVPLALAMNWKLALLMIALMTSFATFNSIAMRRTMKAQGEVEELHSAISERAGDVFGNVLVVQSFTRLAGEVAAINCASAIPTHRKTNSKLPRVRQKRTISSSSNRKATRRSSPSADVRFPAANANGWRLRALCSKTRRS
jgi:ABC-type multidrug transport system fused ATPase/permease subunit